MVSERAPQYSGWKVLNFGRQYANLSTSFLNNLYLLYFVVKYCSVIIESQL